MKRILICFLLALPTSTFSNKHNADKIYNLLIGTYNSGQSESIYVYRFDTATGKARYQDKVSGVTSPSYLAISSNHKFIYSVNQVNSPTEAGVSSFSFDAKSGKIDFINKQPSMGAGPCYIAVDKANKSVFVANYSGGSLTALPINADGSIAEPSQNIQDEGNGPNKGRQEKAHVHTAVLSPDEKYLLYTDLGTDKLNILKYDASATKPLSPADPAFVLTAGGEGPRHLTFSPDAKYMYLITEMGGNILTYQYHNGHLNKIASTSIVPDGFSGTIGAADIHISPDGKFLYSSNRGSANEIEVFSVDKSSGALKFIERTSSMGKTPRTFVIDPTGNFLLVANQTSDEICINTINKTTGKLTYTGNKIEISNPTCLKFVEIK